MIDLFNDNLDKIQSSDLYRALVDFMRLNDPVSDRPAESWRLDFKRQWSDRALQAVAGFANTFGGVLIIGVDPDGSDQCRPGSIFSTSVTHEVKLQIASGIATNISPIPSYRIGGWRAQQVSLSRLRAGGRPDKVLSDFTAGCPG